MFPRTSRLTKHCQSGDDGLTKSVRLFRYLKFSCFYALLRDKDRQIFYSLSSKQIFSATNRNIEKALHSFVVHHLLIDTERFVWPYVITQKQVIQLSKQSVLPIRGCVHLPLQQVFKIILSPDSTFYKLYSDY